MKKFLFLLFPFFLFTSSFAQKYVKVWGDEFNTPGLPDSTKWDYEVGKLRNAELQYYTAKRAENARIQDTVLIIEARKEAWLGASYTSASLVSRYKGDWLYGKFEFSAKVPGGKGTWPAIWMMPTDDEYGSWPKSGEMDIMEYVGMNPSNLYFTPHYEGTNGTGHQSSGSNTTAISLPYNKFINFTFIWSPTKLEWYANGIKYHTFNKTASDYRVWPFNKMFYMILNLAYGGSWGGQNGVDDTKLPHKFLIDYVRVYQLQDTASPFSLKVNPATGGTVEVSPDLPNYPEGTLVTLTAKPQEGYEFVRWLHLSSANPVQIDLNKNWTVTPVFLKKNELILNGDFSQGLKNWPDLYFYSPSTTAATVSASDSIFVVNITKPGTANWHIVGQQPNVTLIQGTTYNISFDAWADNPNSMDVFLSKNYGDFAGYYSTVKNITTTKQKFTWTQKMSQATDLNCRFGFGFGKFSGKVYIDNVSILKVAATEVKTLNEPEPDAISIFPNPTSGVLEITSSISDKFPVTIKLFNLQAQLIATLLQNQTLNAGQSLHFNLKDYQIKQGIYLLTVSTPDRQITRKVIVN